MKIIPLMAVWFNKWWIVTGFSLILFFHPFHVSVTEIDHNAADQTLEISCKLFADDFENVLEQFHKTQVDLTHPADRETTSRLIDEYIHAKLSIRVDGKEVVFKGIGFEKEGEAVYAYFQADNISTAKKIEVKNKLLYDLFTDQVGIIHIKVGGKRKSTKLQYPSEISTVEY